MALRSAHSKGVLLTLATVVLLVLMAGELITYVVLSVNYNYLTQARTYSSSVESFAHNLNGAYGSFLSSSTGAAVGSLVQFQQSPAIRTWQFTNTTQYQLARLITQGNMCRFLCTIPGQMGQLVLSNYTNALIAKAASQGISLSIINQSLYISQSNSLLIKAQFTALAVINGIGVSLLYPINATGNFNINGSTDLQSEQRADQAIVNITTTSFSPALIGNARAINGSTSPFMFVYANAVVINPLPTLCLGIPPFGYPVFIANGNYIIFTNQVTQTSAVNCPGIAGIVTYQMGSLSTPITAPNVPYLVYNSATNVINTITNNQLVLLDGPGLSLLNVSALNKGIKNGNYYESQYAPSYIDRASGAMDNHDQAGIYSFNALNINPLCLNSCTPIGASGEITAPINSYFGTNSPLTVSLWAYLNGSNSGPLFDIIHSSANVKSNQYFIVSSGLTISASAASWPSSTLNPLSYTAPFNGWYNIVLSYNSAQEILYVNGQQVASASAAPAKTLAPPLQWQSFLTPTSKTGFLSGSLANVQLYSNALAPSQITQIYLNGISGPPITNSSSFADWWPLTQGNSNDISGIGNNNAVLTGSFSFSPISNYQGDPIQQGSLNSYNTSLIQGVLNCNAINACNATAQQHLYLNPESVDWALYDTQAAWSSSLRDSYIEAPMGTLYDAASSPLSVALWAYLNGTNNGPLFAINANTVGSAAAIGSDPVLSENGLTVFGWVYSSTGSNTPISYTAASSGWHHIALTYNSVSRVEILYVDGTNVKAQSSVTYKPLLPPGNVLYWTTSMMKPVISGVGNVLNGTLSDVQLYGSTLQPSQINQLASAGLNGAPLSNTSISGWWPLNGNINDYSSNNNTGFSNNIGFINQNLSKPALHSIPNVLAFNGNGYLVAPLAQAPSVCSGFSVALWAYINSTTGGPLFGIANSGSVPTAGDAIIGVSSNAGKSSVSASVPGGTPISTTVSSPGWYHIAFSYVPPVIGPTGTETLYINGKIALALATACTPPGESFKFWSTFIPGVNLFGVSVPNHLTGMLSSVQFYRPIVFAGDAVPQADILNLYLNNSFEVSPITGWQLSSSSPGLFNQTPAFLNNNNAYFFNDNGNVCTNAQMIAGMCGIEYVPPQ